MKIKLLISVFSLLSPMMSLGQEGPSYPKAEVNFGYSFVNVHPEIPKITSYNINGGVASFVYNFSPLLGIKAEFGDYVGNGGAQLRAAGYNGNVSGNFFSYLFGPQIKKHSGRFQPFGQALFGAAHSGTQAQLYEIINGLPTSGGSSNNSFAMEFGGGLDFPVSQHVQIRPADIDYLYTHFSTSKVSASQNNFKYSAGLTVVWGGGGNGSKK
jgi:opacity protein-like surface antigen